MGSNPLQLQKFHTLLAVNDKSDGNFSCTSALIRENREVCVCAVELLLSICSKHLAGKCFYNLVTKKKYWTRLTKNTREPTKMALGMLTAFCNKQESPTVELHVENQMSCRCHGCFLHPSVFNTKGR